MKKLTRDFTKGSIPKHLFGFMLPFMLSNALQVAYNTVDMIIVGKYVGKAGLSAVSQGSQIMNMATMVFLAFSTAGQTLIAQVMGADKKDELNSVIGTMFSIILGLGVLATGLVLIPRRALLHILNMPPESYDMCLVYITICGAGTIFTVGYNMISAVLRAMGDSRRPFIFIAISSIINLVLDILFTGFWGWGVAGAAAATIIGQAVSFIVALIFLYKHKESFHFDFRLPSFKIKKKYAKTIFSLGIPMSIQSAAIHISMLFVNSMVNEVGVTASATFGVGIKIDDLCNKISIGIQYAVAPMVGQNIAAGEQERAKKTVYFGWLFAGVFTAVFVVFFAIRGDLLFRLFTDDADVLGMSPEFIRAILVTFLPLAVMRGSNGFIQGIGNARLSLIIGLIDGVIVRIGMSYLLGMVFNMGFFGFVRGYALAPFGAAIPGCIYFFSGIWKKRKTLVED